MLEVIHVLVYAWHGKMMMDWMPKLIHAIKNRECNSVKVLDYNY